VSRSAGLVASQPVTTAAARAGLEAGRNRGKIVVLP
jgi:hypothetical protein